MDVLCTDQLNIDIVHRSGTFVSCCTHSFLSFEEVRENFSMPFCVLVSFWLYAKVGFCTMFFFTVLKGTSRNTVLQIGQNYRMYELSSDTRLRREGLEPLLPFLKIIQPSNDVM